MNGGERRAKRDWPALMEALGVFLLVMLYIWGLRLSYPSLWVVILGFVVGSHFSHREGRRELGLGWKEFRRSLRPVLPWVIGLGVMLVGGGTVFGTLQFWTLRNAALSLLVYGVWGLFQQYVLNGYFVNRLVEFSASESSRAVPLGAAVLFCAAHLPNWFLMSITLVGGYISVAVFLRYRSLYILGLAHGLIGFLLNLAVPDSITGNFLIGPRYILQQYGVYPEQLL